MHLTKDEWTRHAEIAAAHKFGEDHAGWYRFKRYGAVPTGIAVLAGTVGLAVRWSWHHLGAPSTGLPVAFWILLVALAFGTIWAFRHPPIRPAAGLVRAVILAPLWLGFIVYGVTVII